MRVYVHIHILTKEEGLIRNLSSLRNLTYLMDTFVEEVGMSSVGYRWREWEERWIDVDIAG